MTRVDRIEAWAFERTRLMLEAVGATRGEGTVEAMLAEGLGEILAAEPDIDLPSTITGSHIPDSQLERAEIALLREQRELAGERLAFPQVEPHGYEPIPDVAWPDDTAAIDIQLRAAATELAWRDLELADLARRAADAEIWRALGFVSFDQYCRERIGLAPSSIASRIALAHRLALLPEVDAALRTGRLGYEAAALVARIAGPTTIDAWLARAETRTVKHLREEADAIELFARAEDRDPRRLEPPCAELLADLHSVERAAIATITSQMCGPMSGQMSGPMPGQMSGGSDDPGQMSGGSDDLDARQLTKQTIRLSLLEDTARFWRALEQLHAQRSPCTSFVAFLVRATLRAWSGSLPTSIAYAPIYHRDRWRCASPVCRSRSVTPHHIRFRSRGGTDDPGNLISLCEVCHLELVHGDRLTVAGDAHAALTWVASGWRVTGRAAA